MRWILKTLFKLFNVVCFPYQLKYYFPNGNFSDQVRETSTRAGVWKELSHLCTLRAQTKFLFCIEDSLWLSCKDFIRVNFEMNNFWYEAAIFFETRYTFRFTPLSVDLLIKACNRIVEKQTLNIQKCSCRTLSDGRQSQMTTAHEAALQNSEKFWYIAVYVTLTHTSKMH